MKIQAYDGDEGPNAEIKYTMSERDASGGNTKDLPIAIDDHTGWIYTTKELDREDRAKFMFQVRLFCGSEKLRCHLMAIPTKVEAKIFNGGVITFLTFI